MSLAFVAPASPDPDFNFFQFQLTGAAMKIDRTLMNVVSVLLGLMCAGAVHAAPPSTLAAGSPVYLGVKGGLMDNDAPGTDYALNLGAYGGYNLLGEGARFPKNLGGGTLSAEGEFTVTALKGDTSYYGDWNIMTLAGYAAYRFPLPNKFYLKGKAGVRWQDIDTGNQVGWNGSDTGLSFGLGGGWQLNKSNIEAEITVISSDITFVSLGYIF
jgi:hypothetical protein